MNDPVTVMENHIWRWGAVHNLDGSVHYHRLPLIILPWKLGTLYLHKWITSDNHRPPHDHPKWFVSIGLWRGYQEQRFDETGRMIESKTYRAPWIRCFGAHHTHRLIIPSGLVTWTLVITGRRRRRWGYRTPDGEWIDAYEWSEQQRRLPDSVERFLLEAERG